jgi:hypothetical protein
MVSIRVPNIDNNGELKFFLNIREHGRGNQELTIQRHWQYWAHKTQNEDKQNTWAQHNITQKTK